MKLNLDAVRSVLLCLEQNLVISEEGEFEVVSFKNVSKWCNLSVGETLNTLFALHDAGMITAVIDHGSDMVYEFDVYRITFQGYQLLESIRPEKVFSNIKKAGTKVGSLTFQSAIDIAKAITTPMLIEAAKAFL